MQQHILEERPHLSSGAASNGVTTRTGTTTSMIPVVGSGRTREGEESRGEGGNQKPTGHACDDHYHYSARDRANQQSSDGGQVMPAAKCTYSVARGCKIVPQHLEYLGFTHGFKLSDTKRHNRLLC